MNMNMKVEIPLENQDENMSSIGVTKSQMAPTSCGSGAAALTRQPSATKSTCLCSPTSHAGSFRCRLHRAPSLQRTRSIDSASSLRESTIKASTATTNAAASNANTVEAQ
ncbi:hypothetical protein Tsubulata_041305 [Turnera subulata]|uniref:Uncharacterized protein n=1 Tax=Turnera subulata TaxID=218843 RepID=A0A9Q0FN87_9ROSI|nr:hypothetical protein Tsubulata_041305 [Turnera subulata]